MILVRTMQSFETAIVFGICVWMRKGWSGKRLLKTVVPIETMDVLRHHRFKTHYTHHQNMGKREVNKVHSLVCIHFEAKRAHHGLKMG